jgi:hypothetical protein
MDFKVHFPSGYNLINELNDNIDINVILVNGDVYVASLFTVSNVESLLGKDGKSYLWSTDMIIVKDLNKRTIRETIEQIIETGYFEASCSKIGTVGQIFNEDDKYEDIVDMCGLMKII